MTKTLKRWIIGVALGISGISLAPSGSAQLLAWETARGMGNGSRYRTTSDSTLHDGTGLDLEVADDFHAFGLVTRVSVHGESCGSGGDCSPTVLGAFVRMYEWTRTGPGALQQESFVSVGEAAFNFDPVNPRVLDISLPTPFAASGWHFLSVQLRVSDGAAWRPREANRDTQRRAFVYVRDRAMGTAWRQDDDGFGRADFSDFGCEIFGMVAPVVLDVAPTPAAPNQRLILSGSGFGQADGESLVTIDGQESIVTRRFGNEMHAYVPDTVRPGRRTLEVTTAFGSTSEDLWVTQRARADRLLFSLQTERWQAAGDQFIGTGWGGTVYTSDAAGMYAVAPDGALKWFVPEVGDGRPISSDARGTIYAADGQWVDERRAIVALSSDGERLWQFTPPESGALVAGPNLGPDGNVYAVQAHDPETGKGLGAFSLDRSGQVRWSSPRREFRSVTSSNYALVFGPGRVYTTHRSFAAPPFVNALQLDGTHLWNNSDLGSGFAERPRVDPGRRVVGQFGQTGVMVLRPSGQTVFSAIHPAGGVVPPVVDSRGRIFTSPQYSPQLWCVDPQGNTLWLGTRDFSSTLSCLAVSPDASTLLAFGDGGFGSSEPSWVRAYAADDGAFLWQVDLSTRPGCYSGRCRELFSSLEPCFSPDGRVVYFTTHQDDVEAHEFGWLHAVSLDEVP